jgi:CTP:molybdopterin cytidylyltransferase MocA
VPAQVAGILLAAGRGSRLGRPKATITIGGQTMAQRGIALLAAGGAAPIIVVTGAVEISGGEISGGEISGGEISGGEISGGEISGGEIRPTGPGSQIQSGRTGAVADTKEASSTVAVLSVHNDRWQTGMGSSLEAGLAAVPADCAAAVIALVDQPLVGAASVRRLIEAFSGGATVAVAAYDGKARNPVLISRAHFAAVASLAVGSDVGARPFLRANPGLVTLVECGDTGRPDDIDSQQDLDRIGRLIEGRLSFPAKK